MRVLKVWINLNKIWDIYFYFYEDAILYQYVKFRRNYFYSWRNILNYYTFIYFWENCNKDKIYKYYTSVLGCNFVKTDKFNHHQNLRFIFIIFQNLRKIGWYLRFQIFFFENVHRHKKMQSRIKLCKKAFEHKYNENSIEWINWFLLKWFPQFLTSYRIPKFFFVYFW